MRGIALERQVQRLYQSLPVYKGDKVDDGPLVPLFLPLFGPDRLGIFGPPAKRLSFWIWKNSMNSFLNS